MRRRIAGLQTWWLRLFLVQIVLTLFLHVPYWIDLPLLALLLALSMVRAPRADDREPISVAAPLTGRWVAINSPADKVPSHGVRSCGQAFAIDVLHPRPQGQPNKLGWGLHQKAPEDYSSFGETVFAAAAGTVVAVLDGRRDHRARTTWPGIVYMLTIEGAARELSGASGLLGNHVIVEQDGAYAVYAHLRRGSVSVALGDRVEVGQPIAEVGNSGNTSEPHLHFQLMDHPNPTAAAGLPFRWTGIGQVAGDVDLSWSAKPVDTALVPGLPATGQVFSASMPVASR